MTSGWRFVLMPVLAALVLALALGGCGDDDEGDKTGGGETATADDASGACAPGQYAAVRRYTGVKDPAEAGRRVAEGFIPIISEIDGFVAYYWVDAGDNVMVSTSVFEDKAGAEASTEEAADWVAENLAELLPNPPQVTEGEVVATKC
jgi:hypothetical protein